MSESMQVTNGFIMPTVAATLKQMCEKHTFADPNLVLDIYLIVANQGKPDYLPDEDLIKDIESTDPKYWDIKGDAAKRKEYLDKLAASSYMKQLISLADPLKAVLVFLDHMKKAMEARARVKHGSGPIDHHSGIPSSHRYMQEADLDEVADSEFDPALEFDNLLAGATTQVDVVEDPALSSFLEGATQATNGTATGCGGKTQWLSFSTVPGQTLAAAVVKHGVSLPTYFPLLFDWYTKLLDDLAIGKLKEVDVDRDAKHKRNDQMEDFDRLSTVDAADVAHETFEKRIAEKSLDVRYDRDEERGMSHVFVLLDVSGSMDSCDLGGRVSRAFAANVVTLALLNFAFKDKFKVWVLPFEGRVSTVKSAVGKDEALQVMKWLGTVRYDGGGTDIESAVLHAYGLASTDPTYNKVDIVLITDGCSPISPEMTTKKPERTKLRAIILNDGAEHGGRHFKNLIGACDTWSYLTWDNNKNAFEIGNTLKGISSTNSTVV